MVRKSSSLLLLWCFWFSCSECRLRRFRLLFPRKDLFEAGTSNAEDKKRTTQLCCRWLSISRAHSPCTQTILLDGNQLLFSVTKLILLPSSTIAQVNALERFLEIKNEGSTGFERRTSRTSAECSTTELYPLEYRKSTKHSVFTRIHKTGKKAFVLGVTMIFLAFLLRKPTKGASNFFFHTENCFDTGILRTGDKYCTIRLYSRLLSCSTRQTLYPKKFTWWEPFFSFCHHDNSWFFFNKCPVGHFRTFPLVRNSGHPGSQHVPLSLHTNSLPLCHIPLFITWQSTLFLLAYT